jgi:hypothetical protein
MVCCSNVVYISIGNMNLCMCKYKLSGYDIVLNKVFFSLLAATSKSSRSSPVLKEYVPKYSSLAIENTYKYFYRDGVFTIHYNHDGTALALGFGDHGIEV